METEHSIAVAPHCIESCTLMRHIIPEERLAYLAALAGQGLSIRCNGGHEGQRMRICDQPELTKQAMHTDLKQSALCEAQARV